MFPLSNHKDNESRSDTEALLCNHFFREIAISITYSERVSVAVGIQHAMRMRRNIIWPVSLCYILPHFLINGTFFVKNDIEHTMCALIFSTINV
jgi:hypothetical protein